MCMRILNQQKMIYVFKIIAFPIIVMAFLLMTLDWKYTKQLIKVYWQD